MKRLLGLVAVGVMLLGSSSFAQDASRRALAEELLVAMDMQATMDKTVASMKTRIADTQKEVSLAMGVTNTSHNLSATTDSMMDRMAELMSWENMKEGYITVYAETFTEDELKGLIEFHTSPIGKVFNAKQPELTSKIMQLTQKAGLKLITENASESLKKAKTTSNLNRCINNMRIIDSAKEQVTLAHSYKDGDSTTESEVSEYIKGGMAGWLCPERGLYTLHAIGEEPECSIHGTLSAAMESMKRPATTDAKTE